jgi:hypothetical protein
MNSAAYVPVRCGEICPRPHCANHPMADAEPRLRYSVDAPLGRFSWCHLGPVSAGLFVRASHELEFPNGTFCLKPNVIERQLD